MTQDDYQLHKVMQLIYGRLENVILNTVSI